MLNSNVTLCKEVFTNVCVTGTSNMSMNLLQNTCTNCKKRARNRKFYTRNRKIDPANRKLRAQNRKIRPQKIAPVQDNNSELCRAQGHFHTVNLDIFFCKSSARFARETAAAVTSSMDANCSSDAAATEVALSEVTLAMSDILFA